MSEAMRRAPHQIQFTKLPYIEDVGPRKIESIQFSLFNEADVHKASEVEVFLGVYYDSAKKPIPNGLLDPRMGPPNKFGTCTTCLGSFQECPGHYGYLNLALPVYHVGYLSTVVDILKCICKQCSRILLLEKDRLELLKKMRNPKLELLRKTELLKAVVKRCNIMGGNRRAVKCSRCGYINGVVKKATSGVLGIFHDRSKVIDNSIEECQSALSHSKEFKGSANCHPLFDPKTVHTLLKNMLDEDCELLYLNDRPDKLIITSIPVPPIAIRPSVFVDGGTQSNENDTTERLKRIIQANASLRQELSETSPLNKSLTGWADLQMEVAQYINSDVRGVQSIMPAAKPLSGFVQRLKGKQGRFRQNLSGKRVEFTGRTVISPDPNLKITEVGIPILMARILSYPERVTHHNIEKLRQCVRNGPDKYPGAKYVKHPDGTNTSLQYENARKRISDELTYGCIVDRHLEDGDIVLFNRQPSLHRMSIMSHRAKIMPWRTLRFNESVCNPYNADFDGDEMNMHVPQTEEARTEALMLMGVQNNLCTPKNGEILVASTQDFLTSSFLITRKDTFYDRASFSLMCSYMGDAMDPVDLPTPALVKPVELWTGKQLFSVLIRPHAKMRVYVSMTVKEKNYDKSEKPEPETLCPKDGFVYIRNSELISGQVGKVTLGNGNKDGLYAILLRDYNAHAAAACMNRLAKLSARWIGNHGFSIGIDDVQPGEILSGSKEKIVQAGYGKAVDLINKFNSGELKSLPGFDASETLESEISKELNEIRESTGKACMNSLHWRNSPLIMSQCGSKGSPINISQMVACVGQQIVGGHRAPNGFIDRSLPHFPKHSRTPTAKGFVQNSFYTGLSAVEFFFHTMGGREGLVDTAVKTADTGYMSRRLMKSLEDLYIHYDNTVRNSSACVVQFTYGDDGMDPSQMEAKDGQPLNFDRLLMKAKATCPAADQRSMSTHDIYQKTLELLVGFGIVTEGREAPQGAEKKSFGQLLLEFVRSKIGNLEETKKRLKFDGDKDAGACLESDENVALNASGLTSKQLEVFLGTCLDRYKSKNIEPGTAIGAIGAHSIGEPGTQMTLKTFHFAGVASMNVTLGVPRIKEIIDAAKRIRTPIIDAKLELNNDDPKSARVVKGRIEKTLLGQVAKSIKIVMAARAASIVITLDMKVIQASLFSIDAYSVKQSILQTPRIKLKEQHVKVLNTGKLEVIPPLDKDKSHSDIRKKFHFDLHSLKNRLPSIVVKGINTVERVVISNAKDNKDRCQLFVEGTGLLAVMGIEGIDGSKTISNNIMEIRNTLGIEVARRIIIDEIKKIVEAYGITIDIRHMMLLSEIMTYKGEVLGINRYGLQKMKDSVLMLASFEKTSDHLFNASVNGRVDKIEGVSECIIMGIPIQLGTGLLKIRQSIPQVELKYGADPLIS